jgi:GNAT superfamily N-acetyltransferase
MIRIERTDERDPEFLRLVALLDAELAVRDGDEHAFYSQFNRIERLNLLGVVVAFDDETAVGCGAFKAFSESEVEIKRMFVSPDHRGKRIAAALLQELEIWATELGFSAAVLETGIRQPEAIALYTRALYQRIPNYGQYADVYESVCMRKEIN